MEGEGPAFGAQKLLAFLDSLPAADAMADAVSCAFLPGAGERQEILELTDVEARLCRLIRLLLAEVGGGRKAEGSSTMDRAASGHSRGECARPSRFLELGPKPTTRGSNPPLVAGGLGPQPGGLPDGSRG